MFHPVSKTVNGRSSGREFGPLHIRNESKSGGGVQRSRLVPNQLEEKSKPICFFVYAQIEMHRCIEGRIPLVVFPQNRRPNTTNPRRGMSFIISVKRSVNRNVVVLLFSSLISASYFIFHGRRRRPKGFSRLYGW